MNDIEMTAFLMMAGETRNSLNACCLMISICESQVAQCKAFTSVYFQLSNKLCSVTIQDKVASYLVAFYLTFEAIRVLELKLYIILHQHPIL